MGRKKPTQRRVRCWLFTDDPKDIFDVHLAVTSPISALQDLVKASKIKVLGDVNPQALCFYAVPEARLGPSLDLEELQCLGSLKGLDDSLIVVVGGSDVPVSLNYWLHDDPLSVTESITVKWGHTIKMFRHALLGEDPDLATKPRNMSLYAVSQDMDVDENFGSVRFSDLTLCNHELRMGQIFRGFDPHKKIHLVIIRLEHEAPVQCLLRGGSPISFQVRAPLMESIGDLKKRIKLNCDDEICSGNFRLFKVPIYQEDLDFLCEAVGELDSGESLKPDPKLLSVFLDVPISGSLYVIIQSRTERAVPPPANYSMKKESELAAKRHDFLKKAGRRSPSQSGTPSSFRYSQIGSGGRCTIPCGCPKEMEEAIPATLLHPVFGRFRDDNRTYEPTYEDNLFTTDLARVVSNLYSSEAERVQKVKEVLARSGKIVFDQKSERKTPYPTDGSLGINEHIYTITEFKNENSSTSSDAYFQLIGYYRELTRETAPKFVQSPLPCLLLAMTGSQMLIAAGVWNERPSVQVLAEPIVFQYHSTDLDLHLSASRRLAALRRAISSLKEYYETLEAVAPSPSCSQLFPHQTTYLCSESGATRTFHYLQHLISERLIFLGLDDGDEDRRLCIKFANSYSIEAQKHLASIKGAPKLRGYMKVPGGWVMVVMDMLDGYVTLRDAKKPLPRTVFDKISKLLVSLHDAGYVHGDLRDTNIMVSTDGDYNVMIIDFDWAGKAGEVKYPPNINIEGILRPADARDGQKIEKSHDEFMLEQLVE